MKKLGLNIELGNLNVTEEDKKKSPIEITTTVIKNILLGYAQQNRGFNEDERRQYYKICDIFDLAVKENKEEIEIDDAYLALIKKSFKETKLMPNDLLRKVENLLTEIKE